MHPARRLLAAVLSGLALTSTAAVPAAAAPVVDTPFLVARDATGDLTNEMGEEVQAPAARGLDVLRVRQRVVGNRLVVVSHHADLTRANTNLNPDKVAIGGTFTMFAAYVEPKPRARAAGYTLYFDTRRKVTVVDFQNQGTAVPCPAASARSRVNLETDRVRYVVPVSCIDGIRSTRTTAQAISYRVTGRTSDGIEQIVVAALDMNDKATPRVALR
jgi:hypothetical protein